MMDQLTDTPNRRCFDYRLSVEWNRSIREKTPISILIIDLDNFKEYNDSYGHPQGDILLQAVAKTFKNTLRRSVDFVARWGGEEFIVLLGNTDFKNALMIAERIRKNVENAVIPLSDKKATSITVSIGVNSQIPTLECQTDDFIYKADQALYAAKESGKNRVCKYDSADDSIAKNLIFSQTEIS
jgi:diguanylate cyclase (GGDEF)-like protein